MCVFSPLAFDALLRRPPRAEDEVVEDRKRNWIYIGTQEAALSDGWATEQIQTHVSSPRVTKGCASTK